MPGAATDLGRVEEAAAKLFAYCHAASWSGHDPYDALNSKLFKAVPFLDARLPRLVLTQALKRLPFNLRPLLLVPRKPNPKGHALFLQAALRLNEAGLLDEPALPEKLASDIEHMRSPGRYCCWGYSFPWQTRTVLVPAGSPNLVCTMFVANALVDLFEVSGKGKYLEMAASAAEYMVRELFWSSTEGVASFRYPFPTSSVPVHNANFLAAGFLSRIYEHTREEKLLEPAQRAARYSANRQLADGSWLYGEAKTQNWIDNFHTGYNLCGLRQIDRSLGTDEFASVVRKGYEFYLTHFFRKDGAPKYFHDLDYPIDVHCVAGSMITLTDLHELDERSLILAQGVCDWALQNLRSRSGYFYHQKLRLGCNKIAYMRWGQAWMLLALATVLAHSKRARPTAAAREQITTFAA